jgi:hypothetical protein
MQGDVCVCVCVHSRNNVFNDRDILILWDTINNRSRYEQVDRAAWLEVQRCRKILIRPRA